MIKFTRQDCRARIKALADEQIAAIEAAKKES